MNHESDPQPASSDIAAEVQSLFDAMHYGEYTDLTQQRLTHLLQTSDIAVSEYVKQVHQQAALRMLLGPAIELGCDRASGRAAPPADKLATANL